MTAENTSACKKALAFCRLFWGRVKATLDGENLEAFAEQLGLGFYRLVTPPPFFVIPI